MKIFLIRSLVLISLSVSGGLSQVSGFSMETSSLLNPNPPDHPVRLIFIHHSTGENWLSDENGGLGMALSDNNYYVSDTNYGWGPGSIGDRTDIGHWWEWFRGSDSSTYLAALYNEGEQHSSYSRLPTAPSGENEVILFKSCFPNSALQGNANDPVPSIDDNLLRGEGSGSEYHTVANAKGIYIDLLEYFRNHTDKLFILITAPPLMESDTSVLQATNARALNNWVVNEWLARYCYANVAIFDFFNVLTSNGGDADTNDANWALGNHHRWRNGAIQHIQTVANNTAAYPTGDSHPSQAGNLKATAEFLSILNIAYHRWQDALAETVIYVSGDCASANKHPCSSTLQDGVNSAGEVTTIRITGETYDEGVTLNTSKELILEGGWDSTFATCPSYTTIHGSLTINSGTLIAQYLILE